MEENVISVMGKVLEQIICLVLALTLHTIVVYVEATVNVPLVMEQGSKANKLQINRLSNPLKYD